ncbi:hypothetical protein WV31_09635 [Magnetospirillum sp. ME-1]|uniref:hybrid sensor histidine kinase/response regulator n=1 Tax=Magnetospirillum sp. ME-1 TaxID=1639348 RepID=UPI000A17B44C|nr:hybrid sensor histidine kinase/response regulator [Magnetospirillum sp. ME-1]ARJ65900.1 hypothetical protein WV31_09635 [Magnetospirillum sp. ME-1]
MMTPLPNILVIDDSPESLELMKHVLSPDHRVRLAVNGEAGMALARQTPPDIILLDVLMPGLDGYETCRRLKQDLDLVDVPVIFITAMEAAEDEATGFAVGAVDYITKPISPPLLRARVSTHLALYRQRRAAEQARAKAEEAACAKTEFLSMMSHEIKTPLSIISAAAELLQRFPDNPEDTRIEAGKISKAALRMQLMIEALLADDLLDTSVLVTSRPPVDMAKLVGDLCNERRTSYPNHELHMEIKGQPIVDGVFPLLRVAVANLLDNAAKYSPSGRPVHLRLAERCGTVSLSVQDQGMGIAEEDKERIFQKFFRSERSSHKSGTGLGLYLVRRIAEGHHGQITLESQIDQGSTFTLSLPAGRQP